MITCAIWLGLVEILPLNGAERLEVLLDGMLIPISIEELSQEARAEISDSSELGAWLDLIDRDSRAGFIKLLNAPLLKKTSMGRQILRSWAGQQLLDEISDLIRVDDDMSGKLVFSTTELLLKDQAEVSTLDLLQALPAESIRLDLDGLLRLAERWRYQLEQQQQLVSKLSKYQTISMNIGATDFLVKDSGVLPEKVTLFVSHRSAPLTLEVWKPFADSVTRESWIVLMPGLGGTQYHFHWLARHLSEQGWPVVVLEHPGSDAKAVKGLLEGTRAAPGAEVLPDRIADLFEVLYARDQSLFFVPGEKVVFMGHSLGALTALLAAGSYPEPGLINRCKDALDDLSLTNLSQLMQCQLVDVNLKKIAKPNNLKAIISLNSFGSLLWPKEWSSSLTLPMLFTGGTLDLITPPIKEQLGLFLSASTHQLSRVLLIEGASHFSVIGLEGKLEFNNDDDLFRLGEEFVGVQPLEAQRILSHEITEFLSQVENGESFQSSSHFKSGELRFHRLDRTGVEELLNN